MTTEFRLKKELYSARDIARICDVGQKTVFEWLNEKKLPSFEVAGRHRRVWHAELAKFLEENHHSSPPRWEEVLGHFRVLVVEDETDLLEIIGHLLKEELGVEVRTEENGYHATLLSEGWHPDLILLDFLIPGMNGFEVCKKIRGNPDTNDIPVLGLTSLASTGRRDEVLGAGVSDCLGKPFQSDQLLKKVLDLLGLHNLPGS